MTAISRHPASRNQHHLKPPARAVTRWPGLGITRDSEQSTLFRTRNSIDLLFYHLRLRSFVVIELKATDFDPGYLGQIGMYMAAVDDLLAHPDDKPTIGLLLCRSKNNVVAEYALRSSTMPIGIAEWTTTITTELPDELTATLPSIEDIEAALEQP